jgi:decaprenylphospho-beta-D-erythro-pentofuranosid-2-ulose 2-reductase
MDESVWRNMKGAYKTAIVIGASSGIGAELVRHLASEGCTVAAVARRLPRLESLASEHPGKVLAYAHDVTDYDAVPELFQRITSELGGLDLVVYAAGVMPEVGPEEYDFEKDRLILEVNVLGCIAWLNQAAIRFGNTRSGVILAIGSVAGDRGRAGQPAYNASKAALATYLEALRNRLSRKGVRVVTVKPGPTQTEMTQGLRPKGAMEAATAARLILRKSLRTGEHYLRLSHRIAFFVVKRIPSPIFRRLKL